MVGQGESHLNQRESDPAYLVFQPTLDGPRRLRDLLVVAQAHAFNVGRRLERAQQLAHMQRVTLGVRIAPLRSGRGLLAQQSCRSGLASGHAVDGVVDEDHGDVFTAVGGVQNFRRPNGGKIAVPLITDHNARGTAALHRRSHGRRAPVRGLHVPHVEVVIGEGSAADGPDHDGAVLHTQIVDRFGQHFMNRTVAAAGAEVRLVLQVFLAVEALVEGFGPAERDGVICHRFNRHGPSAPLLELPAPARNGEPTHGQTPAPPHATAHCRPRGPETPPAASR